MATKKTDTDNTTRTTTDDAVNASNTGVVNDSKINSDQGTNNEIFKVVHTITPEASSTRKGVSADSADFVPEGTNLTPLDLLKQAQAAADRLDSQDAEEKERRKEFSNSSNAGGRDVLKHMLRFVESFTDDSGRVNENDLSTFLDKHTKPHKSAKTPYHRISKHCAGGDTTKSLITKRSYALSAIVKLGIQSKDFDAQFDKKEPVGPKKALRSGMQKYIMMYEVENGPEKDPLEKYSKIDDQRLIEETLNMLSVLLGRHKLPDSLVADAKKRLEAELQNAA